MLKEAEAACLDRCLDPIEDQIAKGNWVTGMTLAERRFPQEFGRTQHIEVEQRSVSVNIEAKLTAGQQARLLELLADRQAPRVLEPPRTADNLQLSEPETPLG